MMLRKDGLDFYIKYMEGRLREMFESLRVEGGGGSNDENHRNE
jgi:hypothetical protein